MESRERVQSRLSLASSYSLAAITNQLNLWSVLVLVVGLINLILEALTLIISPGILEVVHRGTVLRMIQPASSVAFVRVMDIDG